MIRIEQLVAQQCENTLNGKRAAVNKITIEKLVPLSRICNFKNHTHMTLQLCILGTGQLVSGAIITVLLISHMHAYRASLVHQAYKTSRKY